MLWFKWQNSIYDKEINKRRKLKTKRYYRINTVTQKGEICEKQIGNYVVSAESVAFIHWRRNYIQLYFTIIRPQNLEWNLHSRSKYTEQKVCVGNTWQTPFKQVYLNNSNCRKESNSFKYLFVCRCKLFSNIVCFIDYFTCI